MNPIIKTENLSVVYNLGKSSEFTALRQANIEVYPGEYIIFFGPSGCGKSTLLYCLTGMENATSGKIFIRDNVLANLNHKELVSLRRVQMGMIFQAYNLIPTISVIDNVLLPNTFLGGGNIEANIKKAKALFERFGISGLENRYPRDLSGGQQQRVAVTRALVAWPPILFCDEPTGNLDSESAEIVMDYLSELNEKDGKTVVLVTHDPSQLHYAHRIFYMKNGQIIRSTINTEKKQIIDLKEKAISSDADTLAQTYPQLSAPQIKAKVIARHLLNSLDDLELERLESCIQRRALGEINEDQLLEIMDRSFEMGGVGLYKQTALNFAKKIERILAESAFVQKTLPAPKEPMDENDIKVEDLRKYLLDGSNINLKDDQELQRLNHFIRQRLEKRIDKKKFQKFLDMPFKKGGVGLNSKSARDIANKLEVVLT